ncbi:UNVERIFIED_CONTAM: hypothetical protein GTU68_029425 [Idotea baltica]|nr:hypothetical protein [Idotea baltica]
MSKKVAVIGSGSWGTALAHQLRTRGNDVLLYGRDASLLDAISSNRENTTYLPGVQLAEGIRTTTSIEDVSKDSELIVFAVPSSILREVAASLTSPLPKSTLVVSGIKGLEQNTLLRPSEILRESLGTEVSIAVIAGPSFAKELIKGSPTAVTIAAETEEIAEKVRAYFHGGNLRTYTSVDIVGAELGGVVKNVIALACGILDGMGFGDNARAALLTRGLAEMQDLALSSGANPRTLVGLSGLGDLLLTAVGDLSRNRQVGLRLGRGEKLEHIVSDLGQVAEGVRSAEVLLSIAKAKGVEMPIVAETVSVLQGKHSVQQAAERLLSREPRSEIES